MAASVVGVQPKTKKKKFMPAPAEEDSELNSKSSKHVTYLKNTLGAILSQCLHEVCQKRPRDPIEFIALCLYKSVDCELYFYEKAIFSKELQLMALELKKENAVRQSNIEKIKKKIQELKILLRGDKKIEAMLWMEARKRSILMAEEEEEEDETEEIKELETITEEGRLLLKPTFLTVSAQPEQMDSVRTDEASVKKTILAKTRKLSVRYPTKPRKKSPKLRSQKRKYSGLSPSSTSDIDKESTTGVDSESTQMTTTDIMSETSTEEPEGTSESAMTAEEETVERYGKLTKKKKMKKKSRGELSPDTVDSTATIEPVKEPTLSPRYPKLPRMQTSTFELSTEIKQSKKALDAKSEDIVVDTGKKKSWKPVTEDTAQILKKLRTESAQQATKMKMTATSPSKKPKKKTEATTDVSKTDKSADDVSEAKKGRKKKRKDSSTEDKSHATLLTPKRQSIKPPDTLEHLEDDATKRKGSRRSTRKMSKYPEIKDSKFDSSKKSYPVSGEEDLHMRQEVSPSKAESFKKKTKKKEKGKPGDGSPNQYTLPWVTKSQEKQRKSLVGGSQSRQLVEDHKAKPPKGTHVESANDKGREEMKASWHGKEIPETHEEPRAVDKPSKGKKKTAKGSVVGSPTEIEKSVSKKFSGGTKSPPIITSPKVKGAKKKTVKGTISDMSDLEDLRREPEKPTKKEDGTGVKGKKRHSLSQEEDARPKKDQKGKAALEEKHKKIVGSPSESDLEGENVLKKPKKTRTLENVQEDGVAAQKATSKTGKEPADYQDEKVGVKKLKDKEQIQTDTEEELDDKSKKDAKKIREKETPADQAEPTERKTKAEVPKGEETVGKKKKEDKQAALPERDGGADYQKKREEKTKFDLDAKKKDERGHPPKSKETEETVRAESDLSEDESKPTRKKEDKAPHRRSKDDEDDLRKQKKLSEADVIREKAPSKKKEKKTSLPRGRESDEESSKSSKDRRRLETDASEEELAQRKEDKKMTLQKGRESDESVSIKDKGKIETDSTEEEAYSKRKKAYKKSLISGRESVEDLLLKRRDTGKIETDASEEEPHHRKKKERESDESLSIKGKDKHKVSTAAMDEEPDTKKKIDDKKGSHKRKGSDESLSVKGKDKRKVSTAVMDEEGTKKIIDDKKVLQKGRESDEDISKRIRDKEKFEKEEEDSHSRKRKGDKKSLQKERQGEEDMSKQREEKGKFETDTDGEEPRKKKDEKRSWQKETQDEEDVYKQREEKGKFETDESEEEPHYRRKKSDKKSSQKGRDSDEDLSKQREERGKYDTDASEEEPYSRKKREDKKSFQKGRESAEDISKQREDGGTVESDAGEEKSSKTKKESRKHRHKDRETDDDDHGKKREEGGADELEAPGEDDEGYTRERRSVKKSISRRMEAEKIDKQEEMRKDEDSEDGQLVSEDKKKKKEKYREYLDSTEDDSDYKTRKGKKDEAEDLSEDEVAKKAGKHRHEIAISPEDKGQSVDEEETKKKKHDEKHRSRKTSRYDDDASSYDGSTRPLESEKDRESLKHRRRTKKSATEDADDSGLLVPDRPTERQRSFQRQGSPDQTQKPRKKKDKRADDEDSTEPDRGAERRSDRKRAATPDKSVERLPGSSKMSIPVIERASVDDFARDEDYDDSQEERGKIKKKKSSARVEKEDGEERPKRDRRLDSEEEESRKVKSEEEDSHRGEALLLKKKSSFLGADEEYSRTYSMTDGRKVRKRRVSKMFTPIQCEWYLDKPRVLVCRHPILGEIRSHQPILYSVLETPNYWDHENFNCRVFYEHEIYSVCDPRFDDAEYKDRMMEWHEEDWAM